MSTRSRNLRRLAVGVVAASVLAFGGVAYAQQQGANEPSRQVPGGQSQQERNPGGWNCPDKEGSGQQGQGSQTEV